MQKLSVELFDIDGYFEPIAIYNNILSVSFGALDRGDLSNTVQWGIYSNTGEIKLIDIDGSVTNLLKSKNKIKARIYASSDRFDTLLATFIVDDFVANAESKEISIQLKDSLVDWQDINVYRKYLFYSTDLYDILDDILYNTGVSIRYEKSDYTEGFFEDIKIYCPYLETSSLWDMIAKVCEVAMCRVYEDEYGNPTIAYIGSTMLNAKASNPIVIRSRNIFGIPNSIINFKTAIPTASIATKDRQRKHGQVAQKSYTLYVADKNNLPESSDGTILPENFPHKFVGNDINYNPDTEIAISDSSLGYKDMVIQRSYVSPSINSSHIYELDTLNQDISYSENRNITGTRSTSWHSESSPFLTYYNEPLDIVDDFSFVTTGDEIALVFAVKNISQWSGNYPEMVTSTLDVKVTGKYFLDNNDIITSYGDGKAVSLPTNELLQTNNTYHTDKSHTQEILDTVQNLYQNGVECVEIECSFSDYYYNDETLALSGSGIDKAIECFQKYDIVTPYVFRSGVEQPYSVDEQGNAKKFTIIGIKYFYAGLLRQTLYLQEVTNTF